MFAHLTVGQCLPSLKPHCTSLDSTNFLALHHLIWLEVLSKMTEDNYDNKAF